MQIIVRQILGYLIFLSNHVCFILINEKVFSFEVKMLGLILAILFAFSGLYDYKIHYKKIGQFKISCAMLIVLNLVSWVFEGSYLFIAINLVLLIVFIFWKRQLSNHLIV